MITIAAAAELLGVAKSTMYSLAAPRGPIPCYRIGRAVRFEPADLDAYLASRRCEPFDPVQEAGPAHAHVVNLQASGASDASARLRESFRKLGIVPKAKPDRTKR